MPLLSSTLIFPPPKSRESKNIVIARDTSGDFPNQNKDLRLLLSSDVPYFSLKVLVGVFAVAQPHQVSPSAPIIQWHDLDMAHS